MFLIYRLLTNLIFILSPIIIFIRLLKKKNIPLDLEKSLASLLKKKLKEN